MSVKQPRGTNLHSHPVGTEDSHGHGMFSMHTHTQAHKVKTKTLPLMARVWNGNNCKQSYVQKHNSYLYL